MNKLVDELIKLVESKETYPYLKFFENLRWKLKMATTLLKIY